MTQLPFLRVVAVRVRSRGEPTCQPLPILALGHVPFLTPLGISCTAMSCPLFRVQVVGFSMLGSKRRSRFFAVEYAFHSVRHR